MADPRISEFTKTLEKNPASTAFARLADIYRKSGETNKAIEICTDGIGRNPSYITGHLILGRCYLERGVTDKAQESFEQALHLDPRNFLALKMLGDILISQGRKKEGVQRYAQILALDPLDSSIHELYERYNGFELLGDPAQLGSVSQQVEAAMSETAPAQGAETAEMQDVFPTEPGSGSDRETADVLDQLTSETTADASSMEEVKPKMQAPKPQSLVNELGEEELIIPDSVPSESALDEVIYDLAPRKQAAPLAMLGDDVEELLLESFSKSIDTATPAKPPLAPIGQVPKAEEVIPADNAGAQQEEEQGPSLAEALENIAPLPEEPSAPEPTAIEQAADEPAASEAKPQKAGSSIPEWAQTDLDKNETDPESIAITPPAETEADAIISSPSPAEDLSAPAVEEEAEPKGSIYTDDPVGEIGTESAPLPEVTASRDSQGEPAPQAEESHSFDFADKEAKNDDTSDDIVDLAGLGLDEPQNAADDNAQVIANAPEADKIQSQEIAANRSTTEENTEQALSDPHESFQAGVPVEESLPKQPEIGQAETQTASADLIADDKPIEDDAEAKDDAPVSEYYNVTGGSAEAEALDSSALEGIDNVEIEESLAEEAEAEKKSIEGDALPAQPDRLDESIDSSNEEHAGNEKIETPDQTPASDNAPTGRMEDLVAEQPEGAQPEQVSDDGPVSEFYNVTGGSAEADKVDSQDLEGIDRVTLDESLNTDSVEGSEEESPEPEEDVAPAAEDVSPRLAETKPERSRIDLPEGVASATLAELFLHQGQRDQAIEVYRFLLSRDPSNYRLASRLREIEMGTARAEPSPEPVRPKRTQPRKEINRRRRRPKADNGPVAPLEDL